MKTKIMTKMIMGYKLKMIKLTMTPKICMKVLFPLLPNKWFHFQETNFPQNKNLNT